MLSSFQIFFLCSVFVYPKWYFFMNTVKSLKTIKPLAEMKSSNTSTLSIMGRQKSIAHQLKLFPIFGVRCDTNSMMAEQCEKSVELSP